MHYVQVHELLLGKDLHLQFRTQRCIIDVTDADAVYVVRSVLGALGQDTKNYFSALNTLYRSQPALYEKAFDHEGFEWISYDDHENSED